MPRAATTSDVFSAIAEPRRRLIVELLAHRGAMTVGAIVLALGFAQPAVSKHLGVLRAVGVVSAIKEGQHRVYSLDARSLKTVHDWVKAFERHWSRQLESIKARAERMAAARTGPPPSGRK